MTLWFRAAVKFFRTRAYSIAHSTTLPPLAANRQRSVWIAAVLVIATSSAHAQTGTITGQIADASGALLPHASVTVTSESTGFTRTVATSSAGVYSLPALPPSVYTVAVSAAGFQPATRPHVTLTIAATLPLNFKLSPASSSVSVDVNGSSSGLVETDSAENSTIIDARQINDLPLILRDPYQLVLLSPGVVTSSNNVGGFSVNGQRERNNNFMLDGADNNDTSVPGIQGGITSANPDSVQEFRIITNNFDAEFGRNTGAIIDVLTRGGSNQFHGGAYEFGRYNALGARDFFNTKANGKQDPYVRNDFGASIGGPLWKDRTFFFLNGEVQRFRTTTTGNTTTPTAAFRTGVFRYTDPTNGVVTAVNLNPTNPDNLSALPFDPTAKKIFSVAPVGQSDNGDGATTTYFFPSPDNLNDYTLTGRLDQKLTERHQLTVRYAYGHSAESDPYHDEAVPGYGNTSVIATEHNGVITLSSALSANKTNILRAGFNLNNAGFFCNHAGIDSLLGTDSFGNGRDILLAPFFNGNAFGCWTLGESNGQARLSSTLSFSDTFNVVKGAHSLKFGGDFRDVKDSSFDNFSSRDLQDTRGYYNDQIASYNFDQNSASYQPFQDLIWGAQGGLAFNNENQFFTANGIRRGDDFQRYLQREWDVFAQDTWKATPKLTLIAGLRYNFNGVPYEKDGNLSNFYGDASAKQPAGGFAFTRVGPGTGRQLYKDSWLLIEPRIGFAFDPMGDGKTAIRGGYGIFHDRIFDNLFGNARSNPPLEASYSDYPLADPGLTVTPTISNQPYPGALTPTAKVFNGDLLYQPVIIDQNLKIPTSQSYNLGVQRQLTGKVALEVNYVGSRTTHALRELNANPPQPGLVASLIASGTPPSALQSTSIYFFSGAFNNTAFEYPLLQTSIASGNYNALQSKVSGRIGGLSLLASYTWAHALDNGADPVKPAMGASGLPRNPFDLTSEYGNTDANVKHRGTVAANYDLPIGKGQAFLNHGILGRVFEGIQISGIEQAQTGLPFELRGTVDNLHTGGLNRPMLVGKPYPSGRGTIVSSGKITGPARAAFANPPFGQDLSIHRNAFSGPGFVNTDVVFQKTQTIFERVKVVFRAESYNVLNHPNLQTPPPGNLSIASSTFGVSNAEVAQNDGTTGARQIQGAIKLIF